MLEEKKRLESKIAIVQEQLAKLPEGKLICSHGKNSYKWFRSDGHNKTYIKKKDQSLAEQLAYKKYLSYLVEELSQEKRAICFYLKHHQQGIPKSKKLITESSEYQKLISPYFIPLNEELKEWMNASYERNQSHPQQLIHKISTGIFVRSKSEAMISTYLSINKIPYRYECALKLGGVTLYPDFTIRHPDTGQIYYWEHFGIMDNPEYANNAYSKLKLFTSFGIIPSINLITTFETKENPLSVEMIEKIIAYYFK